MRSFDLWLRNVTLWEAPPLVCLVNPTMAKAWRVNVSELFRAYIETEQHSVVKYVLTYRLKVNPACMWIIYYY